MLIDTSRKKFAAAFLNWATIGNNNYGRKAAAFFKAINNNNYGREAAAFLKVKLLVSFEQLGTTTRAAREAAAFLN